MRFLNSSLCILVTSLSGSTDASNAGKSSGVVSRLVPTGNNPSPDEVRLSELLRHVVELSEIPAELNSIMDRFRTLVQSAEPSKEDFAAIRKELQGKAKDIADSSPVAIVIADLLENVEAAYTDVQSSRVLSEFMESLQTQSSPEEVNVLFEQTLQQLGELYPQDSPSLKKNRDLVDSLADAARGCAETLTSLINAAKERIATEKHQQGITHLDHIKQTLVQSSILSPRECTAAMVSRFSSQVQELEKTLAAHIPVGTSEVSPPLPSLSEECKSAMESTEKELTTFLRMKTTPTIRAHLAVWAPLDNQVHLVPIMESLDELVAGLTVKLEELSCPSSELSAVHTKAQTDIAKYLQEYQSLRSKIVEQAVEGVTVSEQVNWAQARRDLERSFYRALIVDISPEALDFAGKDSVESLRGFVGAVMSAMNAIKAQEDQSKIDSVSEQVFARLTLGNLERSIQNLLGARADAFALVTHNPAELRRMMSQYRDAAPEILEALRTKYAGTGGRPADLDETIDSTINLAVTNHQTEALRIDELSKKTHKWELEVIASPEKAASVGTKLKGLLSDRVTLKQRNIVQGVRARLEVFNTRIKGPADWFHPRAVQEREIKQELVETGAQFIGRVREMIALFSPEGVDQKKVLEAVIAKMTEKSVDLIEIAMRGDDIGSVAPILSDLQTVVQDLAQHMEKEREEERDPKIEDNEEERDPAEKPEDAEEEVADAVAVIPQKKEERLVLSSTGKFGKGALRALFDIGLQEVSGLKSVPADTFSRILDSFIQTTNAFTARSMLVPHVVLPVIDERQEAEIQSDIETATSRFFELIEKLGNIYMTELRTSKFKTQNDARTSLMKYIQLAEAGRFACSNHIRDIARDSSRASKAIDILNSEMTSVYTHHLPKIKDLIDQLPTDSLFEELKEEALVMFKRTEQVMEDMIAETDTLIGGDVTSRDAAIAPHGIIDAKVEVCGMNIIESPLRLVEVFIRFVTRAIVSDLASDPQLVLQARCESFTQAAHELIHDQGQREGCMVDQIGHLKAKLNARVDELITEAAKYLEESRGVEKSMKQDLVVFLRKLAPGHEEAIPSSIDSAFNHWLDKHGSDAHFLRIMGETEIVRLHLLKQRLTAIAHHAQQSARSVYGQSHGEAMEKFIHAVVDPEIVFSGKSERDYITPEYTIPARNHGSDIQVSHQVAVREMRDIETRLVLNAIAAETSDEVKLLADAARKSVAEVVSFSRINLRSDFHAQLQGLLDDVSIVTQTRISHIEQHFSGMISKLKQNVFVESPIAAIAFLNRIAQLEKNLAELDSVQLRGSSHNEQDIVEKALEDLSLLKVAVNPKLIETSVKKLEDFLQRRHPGSRPHSLAGMYHLTIPGGNAAFQRSFMTLAHHSKPAALASAAVAITGTALVPYIKKTIEGETSQALIKRPPGFYFMSPFMMSPLLMGLNVPRTTSLLFGKFHPYSPGRFTGFTRFPSTPINPSK